MTPLPVPTGSTYSQASPMASVSMDLTALWKVGKTTIPGYVEQLSDALDKIATAMESVQLNWAGDSQKEADDINNRWQSCASALFGTKKNPEMGVLNRIAGGVQGAVLNYDSVEAQLVDSWQKYTDILTGLLAGQTPPGDGGGGGGRQSVPISEV